MSLALRIALLVFVVEVVVMTVIGESAHRIAKSALQSGFDASMQTNAQAIATLAEVQPDGTVEVEFADQVMTRFSRRSHPDLFAISLADGTAIEQSRALKKIPSWARKIPPSTKFESRNFRHDKRAYRGVAMRLLAVRAEETNTEIGPVKSVPIIVFYATARDGLDLSLDHVRGMITVALSLGIVLSALFALLVARGSLRSLRSFAREVDAIAPGHRHAFADPAVYSGELRRPAEAFNRLLRRVESALERERRFSADAAHELRTPVAALKAEIQAAARSPREPAEDMRVLADLEADVSRLESLCEQLLLAAEAPDAGPTIISTSELFSQATTVIESLRATAAANETNLEMHPLPEPAADATYVCSIIAAQRILSNLIGNAIMHGGQGITVRVLFESISQRLDVVVEDTGAGVPEEFALRLFERFARADSSRSRSRGGAGLGLAISRELARNFGGDISYEPREGGGSRFRWTLAAAG